MAPVGSLLLKAKKNGKKPSTYAQAGAEWVKNSEGRARAGLKSLAQLVQSYICI